MNYSNAKNTSLVLLIFATTITLFGCSKVREKSTSEIYQERTIELYNQILNEESSCDCLLAPSNTSMIENMESDMPMFDFKKYLTESLKLEGGFTIDSVVGVSEWFQLEQTMLTSEVKLIDSVDFESIYKEHGFEKGQEIISAKCDHQSICYISMPIFDKNYEYAVLKHGHTFMCLGHEPKNYRKINGEWRYE